MEVNKTLWRGKLTVCHLAEKRSDSYFLKAPPPPLHPTFPSNDIASAFCSLVDFLLFPFFFFLKNRLSKVFLHLAGEFMETQLNISELQTLPSLSLSLLSFVVCVRLSTRLSPSGNIQTVTRSQMEP